MADGSRSFDAPGPRDPATLTAVYRAHAAYVWRVLRHCGVPDPDLDDAVQETFLVVFRRLPELERASLRTWIYAVAVRVASTRRRSQRREVARRERAGRGVHGTEAVDPEVELSKAEAAALVERLLDELDTSKRTVFVLAELEGVKVPEISRILGVNPRTVHSRLRTARESFGAALRRVQAQQEGNLRVARLRPRPLLEQAANDRPPAARRKAALAALAVRIEQGAMPSLAGWQALALGGSWAATWGPAAILGALGVTAAIVATVASPARGTRPTSGTSERPPVARAHTDEPSRDPARAVPPADAIVLPGEPSRAAPARAPAPSRPLAPTRARAGAPVRPASIEPASEPATASPTLAPASRAADVDDSSLAAETRLLEQARGALRRGDVDAALAALDAHAALPGALLRDEARSTRLRVLCAAGRAGEANALAAAWERGQPGSRWHDVIAAACR